MKRKFLRLAACAICAMCVLGLSACNGSDAASTTSIGGADAETSIVVTNEDAPYANVEELFADETVAASLRESLRAMESDGIEMEVTGEENRLVYTFTYSSLPENADLEALGNALGEALDGTEETFSSIAGTLSATVRQADPTVVVRYQAKDGTELISREYTAK